MRILHTSDWHFGKQEEHRPLIDDHRFFLKQLYDIIEREDIEAVICAGDIYDTSVVSAEAITLYSEAVSEICGRLGRKMIVIAGNHDSGARLASYSDLLKNSGLYIYGQLGGMEVVKIGNADIYPIPYFNRDEAAAMFPDKKEEIHSQEDAMRVVCDDIRRSLDKERVNIVVSHSYIVNAELSESDRAAQVGFASAVSKDVFDGFDYVALGHIHKPQVISDTVRYCGSPLKFSFGSEETQEKQVVIFDTETKEQKAVPLEMLHDKKHFEGTYDEVMALEGYDDLCLKIKVTDRVMGLMLMSELKEKFPYLSTADGMASEQTEQSVTMSADELKTMSEAEILRNFLKESNDGFELTDTHLELFNKALEKSRGEGDVG